MTDKQIFVKDINVPRKEQIIIDGVNVGQCKYLNTFTDCDGYHYYCDLADDIKNEYCEHYKNCYFKQLQKEKFENLNNRQMVESAENLIYENSELYKNIKEKKREDRYHKALKEIEQACLNDAYTFADGKQIRYDTLDDILNIINKTKE